MEYSDYIYIMEYKVYIYIYFPLFGVPTLAHKHIMDQRSGVALGVPRLTRLLRLRKGDKTLDNSSRGCWFHTCCQGISWDAICSYLFYLPNSIPWNLWYITCMICIFLTHTEAADAAATALYWFNAIYLWNRFPRGCVGWGQAGAGTNLGCCQDCPHGSAIMVTNPLIIYIYMYI